MKTEKTLGKIYGTSATVIVSVITITCLICKWPVLMTAIALTASIAISSPAIISLQILVWLFQKTKFERAFMWMLLLSSIPLLSLISAWLFADFVPGKTGFVLLLGMVSGYVGISFHSISVAQIFNSNKNEREENHTVN